MESWKCRGPENQKYCKLYTEYISRCVLWTFFHFAARSWIKHFRDAKEVCYLSSFGPFLGDPKGVEKKIKAQVEKHKIKLYCVMLLFVSLSSFSEWIKVSKGLAVLKKGFWETKTRKKKRPSRCKKRQIGPENGQMA